MIRYFLFFHWFSQKMSEVHLRILIGIQGQKRPFLSFVYEAFSANLIWSESMRYSHVKKEKSIPKKEKWNYKPKRRRRRTCLYLQRKYFCFLIKYFTEKLFSKKYNQSLNLINLLEIIFNS